MTATPSIARPGAGINGETGPCGCVLEGGRTTVGCAEADFLRALMIDARDGLVGAEKILGRRTKGSKARIDRFAECRDAYHGHLRGDAA